MRIITITGPAGAGKDTVARMMSEMTDWPVLCSYTTRPMRKGEENGREHWFVDRCDVPKEDMLAYTEYDGHEYWTTEKQVGDTAIYVIDEKGLVKMKATHPDIKIYSIYLVRSVADRLVSGVKLSRILRDAERGKVAPKIRYDATIWNLGDMNLLMHNVADCIVMMPFLPDFLRAWVLPKNVGRNQG